MAQGALTGGTPAAPRDAEKCPASPEASRPRKTCHLRDEAGQALVEFALVMIPVGLMLFGIIDFGRALNYYNDLTQLAGQGTRAAAVNQNPTGGVANGQFQQILADQADSPELKNPSNHVNVCINSLPTTTGDPVTVTVTYSFHFIPLVHPVAITLSAKQTERFEGSSPSFTTGCSGP